MRRYVSDLADLALDTDREPLTAGDVAIDLFHRSVRRGGADVHLPPKEFAVLEGLAKHPDRVLTDAHLLRAV